MSLQSVLRTQLTSFALVAALVCVGVSWPAHAQTPRERACSPENLIPRVLAGHLFGKFMGTFGPIGKLGNKKINPAPGLNEIGDNCIFCVLDEAMGTGSCNENWGDPHVVTQDGLRYDFQAEGDFALVVVPGLEIQARYQGFSSVSFLTALAVRAGDNTIVVGDQLDPLVNGAVTLNGTQIPLAAGDWITLSNGVSGHIQKLSGGGLIRIKIDNVVDLWVRSTGGSTTRINIDDSFNGVTQGLFGNSNGDPRDDLQTLDGTPVNPYNPEQLYGQFQQDWQRTGEASFFNTTFVPTRTPGELQNSVKTLASISAAERATAELQCLQAGIEPGGGLDECVYDLAITGDTKWLEDALVMADAAANSVSARGFAPDGTVAFQLNNEAVVRPDQPTVGAGKLDAADEVDAYVLSVPDASMRLLVSQPPCRDSAAPLVQIAGADGSLNEAALTCGSAIPISSNPSTITVFSTAGETLEYAFDIVKPITLDLGILEPGKDINGSITIAQITSGALASSLNNKQVYLDALTGSTCDGTWQLVNGNGALLSDRLPSCDDIGLVTLSGNGPFRVELQGTKTVADFSFRVIDVYSMPSTTTGVEVDTSSTATVSGKANLYLAGRSDSADDPQQGELPFGDAIPAASGAVFRVNYVVGSVNCCGGNPGGIINAGGAAGKTNISSANNISGITLDGQVMFLAGVFINANAVDVQAPASIDYTAIDIDKDFRFKPLLNQVFHIGDGLTSSGVKQEFIVPDSTTHVYLGFADAFGFNGPPGFYGDNSGELLVNWEIGEPAPTELLPIPQPIASRFDQDNDGWQITGDAQGGANGLEPVYVLEDNGNGYISATDNVTGGTWYFSAPAKFLGDRAAFYDGTLSFELKTDTTTSPFVGRDVVLISGDISISAQLPRLPVAEFSEFVIPMNETAWQDSSGNAIDVSTFRSLLESIDDLSIRGEYQQGPDTGALDNVVLTGRLAVSSGHR